MAREFVPVAAEAYLLYPEDPGHLARVADDPAHRFFRRFGESMPADDWHAQGTKQGIYLIGPEGEYLEGRWAASSAAEMLPRFERAVERWRELRKQRRYANKPVPARGHATPPDLAGGGMLLRVSLRDLPGATPEDVVRWRPGAFDDANWATFMQWAWNQDWHAIEDPRRLVPDGNSEQEVDAAVARRLFAEVFVDRVRGQAPSWTAAQVKGCSMRMRRARAAGKGIVVEYVGEADLGDQEHGVRVRCYGRGEFDAGGARCTAFEFVGTGLRHGAYQANQRAQMTAPSPVGFALRLHVDDQGKRGDRR